MWCYICLKFFFKGANGSSSLAQMSPRSRFRAEMARRGYGGGSSSATSPSSSDLIFRLFQPSSSSNASGSGGGGAGGGPSGFRFFNLGGASSSHNNNNDLDSDLSSDEDEAHWNHNLNSLAQSLPFFLGMRGQYYDFIFKFFKFHVWN